MCPKKHEHISVAVSKVVCAKATHYTGITGDYINKHLKKRPCGSIIGLGLGLGYLAGQLILLLMSLEHKWLSLM